MAPLREGLDSVEAPECACEGCHRLMAALRHCSGL